MTSSAGPRPNGGSETEMSTMAQQALDLGDRGEVPGIPVPYLPPATSNPEDHPHECRIVKAVDGSWRWTALWPGGESLVSRPFPSRDAAIADLPSSGAARGVTTVHVEGDTTGATLPRPSNAPAPAMHRAQAAKQAREGYRSTSERMAALMDAAEQASGAPEMSQRAKEHAAADAGIGS